MKFGVLGAGPAGLFAAWLLRQRGAEVTVFEAAAKPGGITRSFLWQGFTCDLGAHRLFASDEAVLRSLLSLVPMGRHTRRSQIYMHGKWLRDPVNVLDLLYNYFPVTTARIIQSYLVRPRCASHVSFDDYVESRFGKGLNAFFFRPYTEKMFNLIHKPDLCGLGAAKSAHRWTAGFPAREHQTAVQLLLLPHPGRLRRDLRRACTKKSTMPFAWQVRWSVWKQREIGSAASCMRGKMTEAVSRLTR